MTDLSRLIAAGVAYRAACAAGCIVMCSGQDAPKSPPAAHADDEATEQRPALTGALRSLRGASTRPADEPAAHAGRSWVAH